MGGEDDSFLSFRADPCDLETESINNNYLFIIYFLFCIVDPRLLTSTEPRMTIVGSEHESIISHHHLNSSHHFLVLIDHCHNFHYLSSSHLFYLEV